MASIDFPSEPIFQSRGYSRNQSELVRRTVMEDGYTKQARRSQIRRVIHNVQYLVSSDDLDTFETWFKGDAEFGAKFFDWTDPITDQEVEGRIVNGQYDIVPVTTRMNYYIISMQIEVYD